MIEYTMTKPECLKWLASATTNELVVTTVASISVEWEAIVPKEKKDTHLYKGWMSGCTPISLGLALALPHRKVVSLDGDGSILMGLSILPCIAHQNPPNLIVIIWDNGCYEYREAGITRQNPTFTATVADLAKMAQGAGIKNARDVWTLSEFCNAYKEAVQSTGPHFIVAKVPPLYEKWEPPSSVYMDSQRSKYRFIEHLKETENLEVLKGS